MDYYAWLTSTRGVFRGLDDKITAMYVRGFTLGDIPASIEEIQRIWIPKPFPRSLRRRASLP